MKFEWTDKGVKENTETWELRISHRWLSPIPLGLAFEWSLQKWQMILSRIAQVNPRRHLCIEMNGPKTCGLCIRFYSRDCEACPIFEHTGYRHCAYTPNDEIEQAKNPLALSQFYTLAFQEYQLISELAMQHCNISAPKMPKTLRTARRQWREWQKSNDPSART
jgi:hypothetical protein